MLYSEFAEAVGCRDNEHNHEIFRRLEIIYMTDDAVTKEEIYEYGRKLVDNSKTEEEIRREKELKESIDDYKTVIKFYNGEIEMYKNFLEDEYDESWRKDYKRRIQLRREWIRDAQARINEIKWIMGK